LVDDDRLGIRLWMKGGSYEGPTKRGVRFLSFGGVWEEFKKLMSFVDKEYQQMS
jgi:hypothetical protein